MYALSVNPGTERGQEICYKYLSKLQLKGKMMKTIQGNKILQHRIWFFVAGCIIVIAFLGVFVNQFYSHPDTLHLTVTTPNRQTIIDKTSHNQNAIQQIYSHILNLPNAQSGNYSCPSGKALSYHLEFTHNNIVTFDITVNTASCQFMDVYWSRRMADDQFWELLSQNFDESFPQ